MKIREGFILRKVGSQYIVAATGKASKEFHGMIRMDESGAEVFKLLQNEISEHEMLNTLVEKYDIDKLDLKADLTNFIDKLKEANAIE